MLRMSKKTRQILVAVIALVAVFGFIFGTRKMNEKKGDKDITISIQVDENEVFTDTFATDTTTLAGFLVELADNGDIQLTYETTTWGMYIHGLGRDKLYEEDPQAGKYWTYTSENNEQCVKNNFCDAANLLNIGDGDIFVFSLAAYEEN